LRLTTHAEALELAVTDDGRGFVLEEARARLGRRAGDFAEWIRLSLEMPELADKIERIDTYMTNLEKVRARVLTLVDSALEGSAA